ncbi:MAG: response regulator [Sneathiella sp.]
MENIFCNHVLYIEDNPVQRILFKNAVEKYGYEVDTADNGTEGLELQSSRPYSLIAIDYQLPDINGLELAKKLRDNDTHIPILMITGEGGEQIAADAFEAGISQYVVKGDPNIFLELIPNKIKTLIEKSTHRQQQISLEQKISKSEEKYRAIFDNSRFCIHEINMEGKLVSMNTAGLQMINAASEAEILETDYLSLLAAEDRERVSQLMQNAFTGEGSNFDFSAENDGETHHFSSSFSPIKDDVGTVVKLMGITQDITQRKLLEKQVRRSQKMKAVGQLTGGVAHDFNNILGIILGNLEIIEKFLPHDYNLLDRVQAARKGVERGADITRKLLGFSNTNARTVSLTQVNKFIANLESLIAKSLTVSIDVKTCLDKDIWNVEIDSGDLEDCILNLALNARDAMPNGGTLVIRTANTTVDSKFALLNPEMPVGEYVKISVHDTGSGMSDEIKDKIFEPFFTTKAPGKGTGLGLSMVYGFVERSGGYLKLESKLGKGTTFRIYLPRSNKGEVHLNVSQHDHDTLPRGNEKILIVDDEKDMRDTVEFSLCELGYKTVTAKDGISAMEILDKEDDIDFMFSDVVMPNNVDGYQLAQMAHIAHPKLKILLTSGFTSKQAEIEIGDNNFLKMLNREKLDKPYKFHELAHLLHNMLNA